MSTSTQVLVHGQEPFLVKGLESVLRQAGGFAVLPMCGMGAALLRDAIKRTSPDVVLLDLGPEMTFQFLSDLRRSTQAKIILWVGAISSELAVQAITLGIRGILRKSMPPRSQVDCIRKVQAGGVWFEESLIPESENPPDLPLSRREYQVLRLLSQGLKNREIAMHLSVSEGTVKVYLTRLFQKLGARDRFELALFGLQAATGRPQPGDETQEGVALGNESCVPV